MSAVFSHQCCSSDNDEDNSNDNDDDFVEKVVVIHRDTVQ